MGVNMIKVYGYSDDNFVIEENGKCIEEVDCYDDAVTVWFSDGTVIEGGYPKDGKAIWYVKVLEEGTAPYTLTECDDEDADLYSDVFEIDAEMVKFCRNSDGEDVADLKLLFTDIKKKYDLASIEKAYDEVFL